MAERPTIRLDLTEDEAFGLARLLDCRPWEKFPFTAPTVSEDVLRKLAVARQQSRSPKAR